MRWIKWVVLSGFLLWNYFGVQAQEQWGLRLGATSGVNGLALNPASSLSNPFDVDFNLLSNYSFLETNYAFFRNSSILGLGLDLGNLEVVTSIKYDKEPQAYPHAVIFDFVDDGRKRYLFGAAALTGPSALFHLPGGHTLGWVVRGRLVMSGQNVPNNLSYLRYDRRPDLDPFPVHRWEMSIQTLSEVGLHYGHQWETATGTFNAALTAKYLSGYEGFYFENNRDLLAYTKVTGDTIAAEKMDLKFGYTRSNLGAPPFHLVRNGAGWGADLGIEWTWDGDFDPYQWKLGVSLLDLGAIRYSKNAVQHHAVSSKPVVLPNGDYDFIQSPEDLDQMVRLFSYQTLGDSAASFVANEFRLWMPMALSVQAEYGLFPFLWVHGALVQRIPLPGISTERGNSILFAPRFERRWIAAGLPLTIYNLEQVRVGAFLRVGPLVVGTDHFPAFFIPGKLSGGDFYLSIHWPFNLSAGGGIANRPAKGKKGNVKCYSF
ncbi:MAG: hypothetical protein IPJ40_21675 [Saprospirales bacterium]|nr:hypothetical protein [Saprospirales bacterium]